MVGFKSSNTCEADCLRSLSKDGERKQPGFAWSTYPANKQTNNSRESLCDDIHSAEVNVKVDGGWVIPSRSPAKEAAEPRSNPTYPVPGLVALAHCHTASA